MTYFSSANVYSSEGSGDRIGESVISNGVECVSLTNPYGYTAESGRNVTALRYFNQVGEHSSGLLGEGPLNIPYNLVPVICRVLEGDIRIR